MNCATRFWGLVAFCISVTASASPALTSVTGGSPATSGGSDQLYGWIFSVNTPVNVTALGAYDINLDGNSIAHDIGIYRQSDQLLIGSTTVGAGLSGFLDGDFRYQAVSPFALGVGNYVIVMTMPDSNQDRQLISVASFTTAPQITWLNSAFDVGSSLHFPNPGSNGAFAPGLFGPNFQITGVPEPATLALTGLALAGLGWNRRKRV